MGLPEQQRQQKPDVEAIMRRIRDEVKRSLAETPNKAPRFNSMEVSRNENDPEPVIYSEDLNYLNANWSNWSSAEEITSHRKFIGPDKEEVGNDWGTNSKFTASQENPMVAYYSDFDGNEQTETIIATATNGSSTIKK